MKFSCLLINVPKALIFLALSCLFYSCSEKEPPVEPVIPPNGITDDGKVTISVKHTSAAMQYKLIDYVGVKTGIYVSTDSASLLNPTQATTFFESTSKKENTSIVFDAQLNALVPSTKYWYTVYVKDYRERVTYSKISTFRTDPHGIWYAEGFEQKSTLIGFGFETVRIIGWHIDPDPKQYKAYLGEAELALFDIIQDRENKGLYRLFVSLPVSLPFAKQRLRIIYKGEKVFDEELELLRGNVFLTTLVTSLPNGISSKVFFESNGKIYLININGGRYHMYIWDPATNTFDRKEIPTEVTGFRNGQYGHEIDGKIYFPVFSKSLVRHENNIFKCDFNQFSYDPKTDKWEKRVLFSSSNNHDYIIAMASFAYKGKVYNLLQEVRDVAHKSLLKVYDPKANTWEVVLHLNDEAWDYDALVYNDKIYVMETTLANPSSAVNSFKSELFEVNLNSKTKTKLSALTDVNNRPIGAIQANFFEKDGYLYFYGGLYVGGFFSQASYDMHQYDIKNNKWRLIYSSNLHTPTNNNFVFLIKDVIYVGFGTTGQWEYSNEILTMDVNVPE